MLSRELLDQFKSLYQERFQTELSDEEAIEMTTHFLNLMKVLIKPKPKIDKPEIAQQEQKPL